MIDALPILDIVGEHIDELASLWGTRTTVLGAGHLSLADLRRMDQRIIAHEDGALVGGRAAIDILNARLADPVPAIVFAAGVVALRMPAHDLLGRTVPLLSNDAVPAMAAALEWVSPRDLADVVRGMLDSPAPLSRRIGLDACRAHGVDPGASLTNSLADPDPAIRADGFRAVGELGRAELAPRCAMADPDLNATFWSLRSRALLGDGRMAPDALIDLSTKPTPHRWSAFSLALQALDVPAGHGMLRRLAADSTARRWLIHGSGIVGDPAYCAWLVNQTRDVGFARISAEALTLITGMDLDTDQLWIPRPEDLETGPSDDPAETGVDLDPDEGLMWPDAPKVEAWWSANAHRFQPGQRYFMGQPVTREHCIHVLKTGYQRQRILAANYLCLLNPGTPLFNTSAPAWRQQRLLAQM